MKCVNYCNRTYGIGTNPGGGVLVVCQPETAEESDVLGWRGAGNRLTWFNVYGEERPVQVGIRKFAVRQTKYGPFADGISVEWERLEKYLGMDPMKWARKSSGIDVDKEEEERSIVEENFRRAFSDVLDR